MGIRTLLYPFISIQAEKRYRRHILLIAIAKRKRTRNSSYIKFSFPLISKSSISTKAENLYRRHIPLIIISKKKNHAQQILHILNFLFRLFQTPSFQNKQKKLY